LPSSIEANADFQAVVISAASYPWTLGLVRIALLMFLLQIFPNRRFQLAVKLLIVYTSLHTLAFFFAVIFQCSPVSFAWDKELGGHCLNLTALTYAAAVLSGVLDCITLLLPLNELRKLQLSLDKKLGVIFIFIIGSGYVTFPPSQRFLTRRLIHQL
jgi:hypothetical protein